MTRPIELQQMVSQARAAEKMQRVAHHQPAEGQKEFARDLETKAKQAAEKPPEAGENEQAAIKDHRDSKNDREKDSKKKKDRPGKGENTDPEDQKDEPETEEKAIGRVVDIRA